MSRLPVEQRRQQLVDAAIRVMTRDGVTKATTRAISSEADVSLSVFHYCFESKQDLFLAVIKTIVGHTAIPAAAELVPGESLQATVRQALAAYWSHVVANPEEHLLTYEVTQYVLRRPDLVPVARAQYDAYKQAYVDIFTAARELLGVAPVWPLEELADYMVVAVDGLTLQWLVQRDDASAEAVLDRLAEQVAALLKPAA